MADIFMVSTGDLGEPGRGVTDRDFLFQGILIGAK